MRQLILQQNPDKNGGVTVIGKDYRYLRQVLRVRVGDMLSLRCPDGQLYNSTVVKIEENTKKIFLQICADTNLSDEKSITRGVQAKSIETENDNKGKEYWLFQFLPKPQKLEQIIRQATECGIRYIIPVIGEYSEKSSVAAMENSKQERMERIIKEARQQSGSPVNTQLLSCMTLETAIEKWKEIESEKIGFVLSERNDGDGDIRKLIATKQNLGTIGIVVGSEGGLSPAEVQFILNDRDFNPIHFSGNILRCETAALYGIAAVQTAVN